mmetsp:Transcript_1002/g.3198  ORF Transcript_1002/g.3198 Transcript_1002/m.3198 type:complete len:327 (-) Transcript_1002:226-1206(-)
MSTSYMRTSGARPRCAALMLRSAATTTRACCSGRLPTSMRLRRFGVIARSPPADVGDLSGVKLVGLPGVFQPSRASGENNRVAAASLLVAVAVALPLPSEPCSRIVVEPRWLPWGCENTPDTVVVTTTVGMPSSHSSASSSRMYASAVTHCCGRMPAVEMCTAASPAMRRVATVSPRPALTRACRHCSRMMVVGSDISPASMISSTTACASSACSIATCAVAAPMSASEYAIMSCRSFALSDTTRFSTSASCAWPSAALSEPSCIAKFSHSATLPVSCAARAPRTSRSAAASQSPAASFSRASMPSSRSCRVRSRTTPSSSVAYAT